MNEFSECEWMDYARDAPAIDHPLNAPSDNSTSSLIVSQKKRLVQMRRRRSRRHSEDDFTLAETIREAPNEVMHVFCIYRDKKNRVR